MITYPIPKHRKETGSTLVLALMISLLMLVMATALIGFAYFSSQQSYFYHDYAQALYTAEAGLNRIVASTSTSGTIYITDTVGSNNARFYTIATTAYSTGTIYAISTGVVSRIRSVHRIVQVAMIPGDSPWNHMLYVGGNTIPAGNDPTTYPAGYNSTTNGPVYNKRYVPLVILNSENHWEPYYSIATSPGNLYLNSTTAIGSTAGLTISWSGNVCNIYGTYNGVIYVDGSILIDKNRTLTVYGTLISIGGNINIDQNASLVVIRNLSHLDYVTLACIDTTCSDDFNTWTSDPSAGNINQLTGNSLLTVEPPTGTPPPTGGGAVYCSNIYAKNGQGTNINGVICGMGTNINGFPSGSYNFDPTVAQNPPLGFDLTKCMKKRQIASKTWRELPYSM